MSSNPDEKVGVDGWAFWLFLMFAPSVRVVEGEEGVQGDGRLVKCMWGMSTRFKVRGSDGSRGGATRWNYINIWG